MRKLLLLGLLTLSINCLAQVKVEHVESFKNDTTNKTEAMRLQVAINLNQHASFEAILNDSKFVLIDGKEITADQIRININQNLKAQLNIFARSGESGGTGGGG